MRAKPYSIARSNPAPDRTVCELIFKLRLVALIVAFLLAFGSRADSQVLVPHSFTGSFMEDFNYLGVSGTSAGSSWYVEVGGDASPGTLRPRDLPGGGESLGAVNGGLNAGASGSLDRALGFYAGATGDVRSIRTAFQNNTGEAILALNIYYDLELWVDRISEETRFGQTTLQFSLDGATWITLGDDFNAHLSNDGALANSNYWLDEPLAVQNVGGAFELDTPIAPGATFYLQWNGRVGSGPAGFNPSQRRHVGIAIDHVRIAANEHPLPVPEPGSALLLLAWIFSRLAARPRRAVGRY